LRQAVELYECSHRQISACDLQIEAHLQTFTDSSGGKVLPYRPRKRKRRATEPRFEARPRCFTWRGWTSPRLRASTRTPPWCCSVRLAPT
jgi:hypothetical protein